MLQARLDVESSERSLNVRLDERAGLFLPSASMARYGKPSPKTDKSTPAAVASLVAQHPRWVPELLGQGGTLLCEFAGNGNSPGVRLLLDLGIGVDAFHEKGDGYFGVAPHSTALQVAAWRARHETVHLLLQRGANVEAPNDGGETPLRLAVRACVDSYWTDR